MGKKTEPSYPKSLADCADLLYQKRQERLAIEAQAKAMAREEEALRDHIMVELPKQKCEGVIGKVAAVKIESKTKIDVVDWPAFFAWAAKHDAWDCVQRRAVQSAIVDRQQAGIKVPAVESRTEEVLSLTKA